MSELPMLTPADTPIFDEFVITELEKHWDDEPACETCDASATVTAALRCCNIWDLLCDACLTNARDVVNNLHPLLHIECSLCGHAFPRTSSFDDIAKVVPL